MANKRLSIGLQFKGRTYTDAGAGFREVIDSLNKVWTGSPRLVQDAMREYLDGVAQALAQRHSQPWPGGTSETTLSTRSGRLVQMLAKSVRVDGRSLTTITGKIVIPAKYAIHETGGTLTPSGAQYLTIPLDAALTSSGTPRRKSARSWKDTFVARSRAGNLIIFQKRGAVTVPLYVLKPSVKLPPRLGVEDTLKEKFPYFLERLADRVAAQAAKNL